MQAIVLAGGLGTRLREETEFRPKPMVEVGGRPILWHIMKHLGQFDITDFIIAAGYKADMVKQYFLDYNARNNDFTIDLGRPGALTLHGEHGETDWRVTVADTGPDTLTGGRVLKAARYLESGPFMVTYGDGVSNVDVDALLSCHRANGRIATVTSTQPTSRYGVMNLEDSGQVIEFREKPQLDGWINIGYFVMEQEALDYLDPHQPLETGPLEALTRAGELAAYRHTGFWQPMDTYREAQMLNELWDSGEAPWKTW